MNPDALNLLILDDRTLMAAKVSEYLSRKFGERVNVQSFYDVDRCMRHVDEQSHVIILDYFADSKDKGARNSQHVLTAIKKLSPATEVVVITSSEDIANAAEVLQQGISAYVLKRERYMDELFVLLDNTVVSPLKMFVTLPVRQMTRYYRAKDYLMLFLVVFFSIGTLLAAAYFGSKLFP